MKRIALFICTLAFALSNQSVFAQWGWGYNPYMQGYQQGQQFANQLLQQQQNAYNQGKAFAMVITGKRKIVEGEWHDAYRSFVDAANAGSAEGWYWCGVVEEVYSGDKAEALKSYKEAANRVNISARQAIQRINSSGYLQANEQTRNSIRAQLAAQMNMSLPNVGGYSGGNYNSGSSGSGRTCSGCNGTGVCTGCQGKGGYWLETGHYTGGSKTWTTCGSCNGAKTCRVCYGKGKIG